MQSYSWQRDQKLRSLKSLCARRFNELLSRDGVSGLMIFQLQSTAPFHDNFALFNGSQNVPVYIS